MMAYSTFCVAEGYLWSYDDPEYKGFLNVYWCLLQRQSGPWKAKVGSAGDGFFCISLASVGGKEIRVSVRVV